MLTGLNQPEHRLAGLVAKLVLGLISRPISLESPVAGEHSLLLQSLVPPSSFQDLGHGRSSGDPKHPVIFKKGRPPPAERP